MMNRVKLFRPFFIKAIVLMMVFAMNKVNAQSSKKWKLVWSEEFNYTGSPDSTKWGYEVGHIRGNEKQYYTNKQTENIRVENGHLTIEGKKETVRNNRYHKDSADWRFKDSTAHYTSASINTLGKQFFQYGRIEVRAKLPQGRGVWPAIWMMGVNRGMIGWPSCGELDIMEFLGHDPMNIYGTIHYKNGQTGKPVMSGDTTRISDASNSFHLYAMEWNQDSIHIFFDDTSYYSFNVDRAGKGLNNPFRKPFYLLLNLALGPSWIAEPRIDDAMLPQKFLVDYVRVYQKN